MDMKEKLVELLKKAKAKEQYDFLFGDIDTAIDMPHGAEYYADYLIEDGWTKPEWISVKDRLPDNSIPSAFYLCYWNGYIRVCKYWRTRKVFELRGKTVKVTHWMHLPPAPEENK